MQIWVRFLDHSTQIEGAKHVTPWAQTLLSCYRSMSDVERCYTFTSRHRSNYSNEKLDTTTESYCEIAIAEINKWQRENEGSHGPTVTDALQVPTVRVCVLLDASGRARKEAAAQAIDEARAANDPWSRGFW